MKLHSNTLTLSDLMGCAALARTVHGQDIHVTEMAATGSRKRRQGMSFRGYALQGKYATNGPVVGVASPRAATWSAWGYLFAELFQRDPDAIIGTYDGAEDFRRQCEKWPGRTDDERAFLSILPTEVAA